MAMLEICQKMNLALILKNNFKPKYVIIPKARKIIKILKEQFKKQNQQF